MAMIWKSKILMDNIYNNNNKIFLNIHALCIFKWNYITSNFFQNFNSVVVLYIL